MIATSDKIHNNARQEQNIDYNELTNKLCEKLEPELNKKIIDMAKIMERNVNSFQRANSKSRKIVKIVTT